MTSEAAEIALPPPREDIDVEHLFFDSKPLSRKSQNQRYWMLTFDEPEIVTKITLDVDQHKEHYIVAPGGRDANGEVISLTYSFDFTSERWEATRFPEMRVPMFNMDAAIIPLKKAKPADSQLHNLIILSGQTTNNI
jgi:hypothetical protein